MDRFKDLRNRLNELKTELAEARAEIMRKDARIKILEGCVEDMTEEQAALCAEDQSITKLVAGKDELIEKMREALHAVENIGSEYSRMSGNVASMVLSASPEFETVLAALSAAEGGL